MTHSGTRKENILISACLLGLYCRYDGKEIKLDGIESLMENYNLIPVCPEILGGLGTPRKPAERIGIKVINSLGEDVTAFFEKGAEETLKLAKLYKCRYAILKEKSPSCGYGAIYDGTFSGNLIKANGLTADLLAKYGIIVIGETQVSRLKNNLQYN